MKFLPKLLRKIKRNNNLNVEKGVSHSEKTIGRTVMLLKLAYNILKGGVKTQVKAKILLKVFKNKTIDKGESLSQNALRKEEKCLLL